MPNIANWTATNRAQDAVARIADKKTAITIARGKPTVTLAPQDVRVEMDNTTTEITGEAGTITSAQRGRVFGVRNHDTLPDTDIKKGDRFPLEGVIYRVLSVILQTGEIQAIFEATS